MANAFRVGVQVFIDKNLSPAAQSARLAETARRGLAELINEGRAPEAHTTFVDGRSGATEDAVKPGGTILYRFAYTGLAANYALQWLRTHAPVKSGRFSNAFFASVNGNMIAAAAFDPEKVPPLADVIISNTEPYNRKVDVQMSGKVALHFSVPAALYQRCGSAISAKYGVAVKASRLANVSFPGQYVLRGGKRAGKAAQSPGLRIMVR